MKDNIIIDIVSDVVCPWCVIGYKRLAQALEELGMQEVVTITWHPFELNPEMAPEGEEFYGHIYKKYGATPADVQAMVQQLTDAGRAVGFTFDFFDGFTMVPTGDLHILLDYAQEAEKQTALKLRLFTAFFSERKNVADRQVLAQELQAVGLHVDTALARLEDKAIRQRVQEHQDQWKQRGVTAVPTMVFNGEITLVGAQPVDKYKQVLNDLHA